MGENIIKNIVMKAVRDQLSNLEGKDIEWPDHTITFLGQVKAGKAKFAVHTRQANTTVINIQTANGPHRFKVTVAEEY